MSTTREARRRREVVRRRIAQLVAVRRAERTTGRAQEGRTQGRQR